LLFYAQPLYYLLTMGDQKRTRRELLETFVTQKPDDAFSRYGLAMECLNGGDTSAAESHFRELLLRNTEYVPAYLMFAQMLVKESRPDDAREVLQKGIAVASHAANAHALSEMEELLSEL
jgi:Tfp pilus assembly protein PilF